jgi:hypothetical protein
MASRPTKYRYRTLDTSKRQIRLLHVLESQASPTKHPVSLRLKLSLETFDLHDAPPYAALSYTWGPENPTYDLVIEGRDFRVRENLFFFFKELPQHDANTSWDNWLRHTRYIWIDQICINQADVRERNHQVGLMSRIYKDCEIVVVWLGDPTPAFRKAARKFYGRPSKFQGQRQLPAFGPLSVLLRDNYFTRLWIVQEVLLAERVTVMCHGGVSVYWPDLYKVALQDPWRFKRAGIPLELFSMLECSSITHYKSLKWCIDRFSGQECREPRDKVYGLLGIVKKHQQIKVDYEKPIQKVFLDVIRVLHSAYLAEFDQRSSERAVYWFCSVAHDYRTTLETLAQHMGFEEWDYSLAGVRGLLKDVFGQRKLKRVGSQIDHCLTKKNIDFKFSRSKYAHLSTGRWWREVNNDRVFYACRPCLSHVARKG